MHASRHQYNSHYVRSGILTQSSRNRRRRNLSKKYNKTDALAQGNALFRGWSGRSSPSNDGTRELNVNSRMKAKNLYIHN